MGIKVKLTDEIITSHAGLYYVGKILNDQEFSATINKVSKIKKRSGFISDYDILKAMIGLIAIGKPYYDAVEEYREDVYFKKVLKLKKVPSSAILRQRLDNMPKAVKEKLIEYNRTILRGVMESESEKIGENNYLMLDFDVTPMDNSNTQKEGVSKTYKLFDGYAPMFSYVGRSGFIINNQLREGSAHSNCEGNLEHMKQTVEMALSIYKGNILVRFDSGNDSIENILMLENKERTRYIVKRNLRRESKEEWLNYAKEHAQEVVTIREGLTRYYALATREIVDENAGKGKRTLKILVVATEETIDEKGQSIIFPKISIESYWTNLEVSLKEMEQLYHEHGTCEQYHSEFKSDLDMERLPSGKFQTNELMMHLGMLAFNILRLMGKDALRTGKVPGHRGKRLRIRTILQNFMYMGGRFLDWIKNTQIRIFRKNKWAIAYLSII
jgi:hypothetical protein